ncbi:hypothetical protein Cch01nite_12820 [Cellulomonas chitinilytica]|uniref:Uncharacterized protein n=1 Tax=Cellulomonas chitinilytica TaxID=398759 RepID=A0A919TZ75_9CELL|nr:hypothetical protein [Cellulomonas chitinilytica]GIG20558.1 hypothetical protein Cch01nite_12820 [Cellulomonas chitinilytica]
MSTPTAARRDPHVRFGIEVGAERRDIALRPDVRVGDAMRSALLPVGDEGVLVLDSTGRAVPLDTAVGAVVADGGLLHVVRRAVPRGRAKRWAAERQDVVLRRPPVQTGALAVATALGAGTAVAALLPGTLGAWSATVAAVALGIGALAAVLVAAAGPAAAVAGPTLGFATTVLALDAADPATARLSVTAGLVVATLLAGARLLVSRSSGTPDDLAGPLFAALAAVAVVQAVTLLAALPSVVGAAALVGAAPVVVRLVPQLSIAVPDEQLIDLSRVSRTALSVRTPRVRSLGRVNERLVLRTVASAERRKDVATVVATVLPVALLPWVLATAWSAGSTTAAGVAGSVLVTCVVGAFALGPRGQRGRAARWAPRVGAAVVLVEAALLAPVPDRWRVATTIGALVLALAFAAVVPAVARGQRSVLLSHLGDRVEGLAVALSLPAALCAADLVDTLRKVASG